MGKMLILIAAVLFGFLYSGKGILKTWIVFLCAVCSIYPAVWALPELSAQLDFFPKEAEAYKSMILIAAVWILLELIFHNLISKYLIQDPEVYEFPSLLDRIGGICFGALSGILFLGIVALALAVSPFNSKIPSLSREDLLQISNTVIPRLSSAVDRFSFQDSTADKGKFLTGLYYEEEIPQETTDEKTKKENGEKAEKAKGGKESGKAGTAQKSTAPDEAGEEESEEELEEKSETKPASKTSVKKAAAVPQKKSSAEEDAEEPEADDSESAPQETNSGIRTPTPVPLANRATAKIRAMAAEEQQAIQKEALGEEAVPGERTEKTSPAEEENAEEEVRPAEKTKKKSTTRNSRKKRSARMRSSQ